MKSNPAVSRKPLNYKLRNCRMGNNDVKSINNLHDLVANLDESTYISFAVQVFS